MMGYNKYYNYDNRIGIYYKELLLKNVYLTYSDIQIYNIVINMEVLFLDH